MPQAKALSRDPTLSSKGYSTLLWEALAGHLLTNPEEECSRGQALKLRYPVPVTQTRGTWEYQGLLSH